MRILDAWVSCEILSAYLIRCDLVASSVCFISGMLASSKPNKFHIKKSNKSVLKCKQV